MGFVEAIRKHIGNGHPGNLLDSAQRSRRRRLIFEDTMALLSLLGITLVLSVITYFFFTSFHTHRQVLEQRWYARGQQAMASGNALYAVEAFRSALALSSGNRTYELALANALLTAGRTDEAYAYYSTLRDEEPGDGLLNLQLARLSVKKKDSAQAIAYYQAALNGDWHAEGVSRRREARLELAQYLLTLHQPLQAQEELLTAEGNALESPAIMNQIAAMLQQANYPSDALTAYQRAQQHARSNSPEMLTALLGESRVAESLGNYKLATYALARYMARVHQVSHPPQEPSVTEAALDRLQRLMELNPLPNLPPRERAQRLLADGALAHHRFVHCIAQLQGTPTTGPASPTSHAQLSGDLPAGTTALATLAPLWQPFPTLRRPQLAESLQMQESLAALINQTEILTNRFCGPPQGDNALLLQLATVPNRTE